jgi:hypothetical protein
MLEAGDYRLGLATLRMPSLVESEEDSVVVGLGTTAALGRVEACQIHRLLPAIYQVGAGPDFHSSRGESSTCWREALMRDRRQAQHDSAFSPPNAGGGSRGVERVLLMPQPAAMWRGIRGT